MMMNCVQFDAAPMDEMCAAPKMQMAMMRNESPQREEMRVMRCASLGEAEENYSAEEDDAENLSGEYCRRDSSDGDGMPA